MRRVLAWVVFGLFLPGGVVCAQSQPALAQQPSGSPASAPGKIEPGRLGVQLRELSEASVKALALDQKNALLVELPAPGGPAERAGLLPGDVLLELEGVGVGTLQMFVTTIQALGAGRTVNLRILRGNERLDLSAMLGRMAEAGEAPSVGSNQRQPGYVGLNQRNFSQQSMKALGLSQPHALLVRQPLLGSPAEKAGLKTADIILALDGLPVTTVELFDAGVSQRKPGQEIRLDILRDRAPLNVSVVVGVNNYSVATIDMEEVNQRAIRAHQELLTAFDRKTFPFDWAITQRDLGLVYTYPILGNRSVHLENALKHLNAAQSIFTPEVTPFEWISVQQLLGLAYEGRVMGDRADNLESAIAAYEATLLVAVGDHFRTQKALAQSRLGAGYLERTRGDVSENVEKAILELSASLEALPRDEWIIAQMALARAYRGRLRGIRAENQEKAIALMSEVGRVYPRQDSPFHWAWVRQELGRSYRTRIKGDRSENQELAIDHLEQALSAFSKSVWPTIWGETQASLAAAYHERIRGDQFSNLQKAIAAYEAALTMQAGLDRSRGHLSSSAGLGRALAQSGQWTMAKQAYAGARDTFLTLFGQGLNDKEARDLISQAGSLFADSAYAAAQLGESENALLQANEGRARLIAIALKLQTLDLPLDKRRRLDELRAETRVADRTVEVTQGGERAAAVVKLVGLRQELLALVKEAEAGKGEAASALAQTRAIADKGGAVVVPIVTKVGGKLLIVAAPHPSPLPASGEREPGARKRNGTLVTILDLPELTTDRLEVLLRGDGKGGKIGGWLRAYGINYLSGSEAKRYWPEWLAAVDGLGPELWNLLGAKLDAALKARGVKAGARVVWLPSGGLGILPLGLAQDRASKRRLADGYEIVYAPSLEALASSRVQIVKAGASSKGVRPAASDPTLAAIINPTGDLPATETEGKLVASHFGASARAVLEKSAATPDAVLAALKGRSYWHFASHGTFSWEDARQSALLMHERDPLSVGRLLDADGLGRPRLVVLSACETGLYDISRNPDEFIGLPGTFTALGAAGVLGTLWPVADEATALLIAKFYELHMGSAKLAPPTALARAQAWLKTATNRDLAGYARLATKQGRLEARLVREIEQRLSEEGLARSRNSAVVEWIGDAPRAGGGSKTMSGGARLARPYAHPYFWAGFIYTGL